jgi:hypothetical protein
MPNDCYNRLIIRSPDNTKIEEAIAAFKAGKLLNYFVPQPADLDQTSILDLIEPPNGSEPARIDPEKLAKLPKTPEWYTWRNEHWGTKWDIYNQFGYKRTKTAVEFDFNTAWSPPIKAYEAAMADHGFEVEAEYDEPNMLLSGYWFPKRGFHLRYDYEWEPEVELPEQVWEGLRGIWIGLGDDEIIAGEKLDATRTWSDLQGGKIVDDAKNKELSAV